MPSLRRYLAQTLTKRASSLTLASTDSIGIDASARSSISARHSAEFPFHLDPKIVAANRHESHPRQLPGGDAGIIDVRYFLFALLTSKKHKCAKKYPEWVLETCMEWSGTGRDLCTWSDAELRNICPRQAAAVGIISNKHEIGMPCPPTARAMIGDVVADFVLQQKSRSSRREHIQRSWDHEIRRTSSTQTMNAHGNTRHDFQEIRPLSRGSTRLPDRSIEERPLTSGGNSGISGSAPQLAFAVYPVIPSLTSASGFYNLHSTSAPLMTPKAPSISSSLSSLAPTDSISARQSESTTKTSPPSSSHDGPTMEAVHEPDHRRLHTWGTSGDPKHFNDPQISLRELKMNLGVTKPARQSHSSGRASPSGQLPARYRPAALSEIRAHAPKHPSLLRRTTTLEEHHQKDYFTDNGRYAGRPYAVRGSERRNQMVDATLELDPASLGVNSMSSRQQYESPKDGYGRENSVAKQVRHDSADSNMTQHDNFNYRFAFPDRRSQHHSSSHGGEQAQHPYSREVTKEKAGLPYHMPRSMHRRSSAVQLEPTEWLATSVTGSFKRHRKVTSRPNPKSAQESEGGRSVKNYGVDNHALNQAEGIRHKSTRSVQRNGKLQKQSELSLPIRNCHSAASIRSKLEKARNDEPSELQSARSYWDPVLRRSRPTLFEAIRERDEWSGDGYHDKLT